MSEIIKIEPWPDQTTRDSRLPGYRYTSRDFFEKEWEGMWTKVWPNLRPHAFPFLLEEIPRRVAVTWETRVPCRLIRPRFDFDNF